MCVYTNIYMCVYKNEQWKWKYQQKWKYSKETKSNNSGSEIQIQSKWSYGRNSCGNSGIVPTQQIDHKLLEDRENDNLCPTAGHRVPQMGKFTFLLTDYGRNT